MENVFHFQWKCNFLRRDSFINMQRRRHLFIQCAFHPFFVSLRVLQETSPFIHPSKVEWNNVHDSDGWKVATKFPHSRFRDEIYRKSPDCVNKFGNHVSGNGGGAGSTVVVRATENEEGRPRSASGLIIRVDRSTGKELLSEKFACIFHCGNKSRTERNNEMCLNYNYVGPQGKEWRGRCSCHHPSTHNDCSHGC